MKKLEKNEFNMVCDCLNGIIIDFEQSDWRDSILDNIYDSNLESKWGVNKKELIHKLCRFTNVESLELIVDVDQFWDRNENKYQVLGKITPKAKILEITSEKEKHEPIIWNSKVSSIRDFYMVAQGLNLECIIFVQNYDGKDNSIWATSNVDLLDCLLDISERLCFSRVVNLQTVLIRGF
jgi:hypothetical protein